MRQLPAPLSCHFGLLLLLLAITTCSCRKSSLCHDAELEVAKQPYTGRGLRLDGCYYGNPDRSTTGPPGYEIIIPYRDGVLLLPGGAPLASLKQYVEDLRRNPASTADTKYCWGLFAVSGTTITLAHWQARPCSYWSVLRTGQLLNDSTFVISRIETTTNLSGGKTVENVNLRYELRRTAARPDSTNGYL